MKKIFSILLASLALASCVDTVILPDNKTVDEDFWQKKNEVDAVVAAAYAQLRDPAAIRNMIIWGDFRSDELIAASNLDNMTTSEAPYKESLAQIHSLNITTENAFTTWTHFYSAINYCNLVLEKAEDVIAVDPDYTQGDYDANKAQMLALRALCYFYLVRVFHDVPVTPGAYLNSGDDLNAFQVSPDSVLTMCINDLEEASQYAIPGITYTDPTTYQIYRTIDWRDRGYLNQDGINAILADIYLWRASINGDASDYQACVDYCDKVIKAKKEAHEYLNGTQGEEKEYYLTNNNAEKGESMYQIFSNGNVEESIFELQYMDISDSPTNDGLDQMYFRYKNDRRNSFGYLKVSKTFGTASSGSNIWKNKVDIRFNDFIYDTESTNSEQYNVRKFVALNTSSGKSNPRPNSSDLVRQNFYQNWILYRLTDVMLMKAEALVQLYELNGEAEDDTRYEEALAICQFINDRSIPEGEKEANQLKPGQYKNMEELVLSERARELCFEGKRWFDLMRYNYRHTTEKADLTKKLTEGYVMNSDEFFNLALSKYTANSVMRAKIRDERYLYMPINQDEMNTNPNLVQNPVYQSSSKY